MNYKRVAILRGGPGVAYDRSMKTGAAALQALDTLGYSVKDIVITKSGKWLENGIVRRPQDALEAIDVVFITITGMLTESGELQKILQRLQIPYTGSGSLTSSMAFNKALAKNSIAQLKIKTPRHQTVTTADLPRLHLIVEELNRVLGEELFVKPLTGGSSYDARYTPNPASLSQTLKELLQANESVIVEEYIRGREATVPVLEDFRQQPLYVLPVVEIVPPAGEPLYSFAHKEENTASQIAPGRFSYHEKAMLEDAARAVHRALHCTQFSRSDFIVRNGEIYFLEVNTLPDIGSDSSFAKSLESVGHSYLDFIAFLVNTAKR